MPRRRQSKEILIMNQSEIRSEFLAIKRKLFDKVYADDTAHVCGFKYFDKFKQFGEIQDVIDGKIKGRESDKERILSYNIGLGLHDIVYATKIYDVLKDDAPEVKIEHETEKFWI
jgi:ornithine cyclodeaminase/alanine dehydrogenase-like protein (mu-crystallin family)